MRLFEYMVQKGASINFIGDKMAFDVDNTDELESQEPDLPRYETCLDFALQKFQDLIWVDYNFAITETVDEAEMKEGDDLLINKTRYVQLLKQAHYLRELVHLKRLISHIRNCGGKTYQELSGQ
jgi:hypothetical protein